MNRADRKLQECNKQEIELRKERGQLDLDDMSPEAKNARAQYDKKWDKFDKFSDEVATEQFHIGKKINKLNDQIKKLEIDFFKQAKLEIFTTAKPKTDVYE